MEEDENEKNKMNKYFYEQYNRSHRNFITNVCYNTMDGYDAY